MAKVKAYVAPKPARSHGYGAVLFFTLLAMLGGIALILLELSGSYQFDSEAKLGAVPKVNRTAPTVAQSPNP